MNLDAVMELISEVEPLIDPPWDGKRPPYGETDPRFDLKTARAVLEALESEAPSQENCDTLFVELRMACEYVARIQPVLRAVPQLIQAVKTINTPRTDDFFEAVRNEAAHQVGRWGTTHDAGKTNPDWFTLIVYLQGKAVNAYWNRDQDKLKHHIVSTAAALLNWLRALNGESVEMRPGVG